MLLCGVRRFSPLFFRKSITLNCMTYEQLPECSYHLCKALSPAPILLFTLTITPDYYWPVVLISYWRGSKLDPLDEVIS